MVSTIQETHSTNAILCRPSHHMLHGKDAYPDASFAVPLSASHRPRGSHQYVLRFLQISHALRISYPRVHVVRTRTSLRSLVALCDRTFSFILVVLVYAVRLLCLGRKKHMLYNRACTTYSCHVKSITPQRVNIATKMQGAINRLPISKEPEGFDPLCARRSIGSHKR